MPRMSFCDHGMSMTSPSCGFSLQFLDNIPLTTGWNVTKHHVNCTLMVSFQKGCEYDQEIRQPQITAQSPHSHMTRT